MKWKWRCPTSVWCLPCAWQPFPLVSASRWLKKRGELAISSEELSIWRAFSHRSNYLFLFNDVLIVTKKKRSVVMNYGQLRNIERIIWERVFTKTYYHFKHLKLENIFYGVNTWTNPTTNLVRMGFNISWNLTTKLHRKPIFLRRWIFCIYELSWL